MPHKFDKTSLDDIVIVQTRGVYYIYINGNFYSSCDSFSEVKEEIVSINVNTN